MQQEGVGVGAPLYLGEGISRGEQHILRFEVTVNDVFKVQMPQRNQNLFTQEHKQDMKATKASHVNLNHKRQTGHLKKADVCHSKLETTTGSPV